MVKAVKGFMTTDGRFFEGASEAELNEAEEGLRKVLAGMNSHLDIDEFITVTNRALSPLLRYINAVLGKKTDGKDNDDARGKEEQVKIEADRHSKASKRRSNTGEPDKPTSI